MRKINNWLYIKKGKVLKTKIYGSLKMLLKENPITINGEKLDYNKSYYLLKLNNFKMENNNFIIEKKQVKTIKYEQTK